MNLPLEGQTILVTRPAHQAAGLTEPLESLGATVFALPAIAIAPPDDLTPLDAALRDLQSYDWVVLTSVNGVEAVRARMVALEVDPQALCVRRLAAVGPSTAKAMGEAFREPDLVPAEYMGERVAEALGNVAGQRFLMARADIAREELPRMLRERGAHVDDPAAYRIVRPDIEVALPDRAPDWITLTSSSAVYGTREALAARGREAWMTQSRLACIGPITAATVRELGLSVDLMADDSTITGLVEALTKVTIHA